MIAFTKTGSSPRDIYRELEDELPRLIESARSKLNSHWKPGELYKRRNEEWEKRVDLKLKNLISSQRSESPYSGGSNSNASPAENALIRSRVLDSLSNNNSLGKSTVHGPENDIDNVALQKLIK